MFVEHKAPGEVRELDGASNNLLRAASLIEKRGWHQGSLFKDGRYCIVGAISNVRNSIEEMVMAWSLMDQSVGNAAMWNDTPGRTKDEVVAKLRAVALGRVQ